MKINSKGQVTIPAAIRAKAGLWPHTEVEFVLSSKRIYMQKSHGSRRGKKLIESLKGKGAIRMTTGQIMALTRD